MPIGEGGIQVDDGKSRRYHVYRVHIRSRTQRVRRIFPEIDFEQRAQQFLGALLACGRQRNVSGLRVQRSRIVVRNYT